jgi:hypothetical protein
MRVKSQFDMERSPLSHTPGMVECRFGLGIDDVIILPLVLVALAGKYLFKAAVSILIHVLDYAFPVLLQLVRFPLFTLRIIGDGVAALIKGVVRYLPVSGTTRERWRELVSRRWSWLKQKISYKAFEQALHHAFESGMAWVFRKCRMLTPGGALLVIAGAVVWLPVSFVAATAMHALLIAKAASLPAWMQVLHLLATVVAKSKLLILPAYPAAWPQAKKHPFVQATFLFYRYLTSPHLMQKAGYRYRQAELAVVETADALGGAVSRLGLGHLFSIWFAGLNRLATSIGNAARAADLSRVPLIGAILTSYAAHYADVSQQRSEGFSARVRGFFDRWSIKFSAQYYEAKEKHEPAERLAGASAGTDQPVVSAAPLPPDHTPR